MNAMPLVACGLLSAAPDADDGNQRAIQGGTEQRLIVDRAQIAAFLDALFRYAEHSTYLSFRIFGHQRGLPPRSIVAVRLGSQSMEKIVDIASHYAQRAADDSEPAVFAPPIATFQGNKHAAARDIANGVSISIEIDDADPDEAVARLTGIIGVPPTIVMHSGSDWTNPETGEVKPKVHLHWRLSEVTTIEEEHQRLNWTRKLATMLAGGDPTANAICHPLRCPGTWNRKRAPRMAQIVVLNPDAEVHLADAEERLSEAVEAAGIGKQGPAVSNGNPQADATLLVSAMAAIPNNEGVHYVDWIRLGYAAYRATGGSEAGFTMWNVWSQKSSKYDPRETVATWNRIGAAGPRKSGAGTIFFEAERAGWKRPPPSSFGIDADAASTSEPSSGIENEGYVASLEAEQKQRSGTAKADDAVRMLNEKYMLVLEQGKAIIYSSSFSVDYKRHSYNRSTLADFRAAYMNWSVQTDVNKKGKPEFAPAAEVWLSSPQRRQYLGGVIFDPSGKYAQDDTLNLWRGFAYQPKPGSWQRLKNHILNVICCGNREYYDYLIGWMAQMFQRPAERAEVAVVMKGEEGTGKGILANILRDIIGQHSFRISNAKHLVGNFNAHLRDCVFLFADEAFFAGDKAHIGALKSLITEDTLTVEAKFQNVVNSLNYIHLMMASNEDWVVPASLDARRFFVLIVANTRKRDFAYFDAIQEEMRNGGYEAMLHDLLNYDLSQFNICDIPETEGLQEQKKMSLPVAESWWVECLQRGYVFKSQLGLEDYFMDWHEKLSTDLLFASYKEYAQAAGERRPKCRETFGKWFTPMAAGAGRLSNAVVGEHMTEMKVSYDNTKRTADVVRRPRPPGYHFGTLQQARDAFVSKTNLLVSWEDEGLDDLT